jgi:predicted dithiol-disulfide oxidoreductase (DUF899 family)
VSSPANPDFRDIYATQLHRCYSRCQERYSPLSYVSHKCLAPTGLRSRQVVSREEWVARRKDLLAKEKEALRASDVFHAQMRDFPMVHLDKSYIFEGLTGNVSLLDLFNGRKQLIVYHLMMAPDWEEACSSCSFVVDHIPDLSHLHYRSTSFVAVSRAPIAKIEAFKKRMGWTFPWVSSFGSDFNYDFHVTQDEDVAPVEYNYKDKATLEKEGKSYSTKGEQPGLSIFYREDGDIFHTYSSYARGLEVLLGTYKLLDLTPLGRQEEGPGPKMSWRFHDKYEEE